MPCIARIPLDFQNHPGLQKSREVWISIVDSILQLKKLDFCVKRPVGNTTLECEYLEIGALVLLHLNIDVQAFLALTGTGVKSKFPELFDP